ncbi:MAG: ABC transporter permease [Acidobacteria bacterium]|nr:ABC transporter permease [Acidobacteriota bacterium]
MNYWMILKISLKALNRNKVRSALTMLGIIIGVSAVIAMVSLGEGARRQIQEEIASLGDSTVWVRAGSRRSWGVRSASGTMNTLKAADFEAMLNECPAVKAVSPSARSMAQVVFGNQNWNTRIEGYNELYPDMRNWVIAQGSFFDDTQVKAAARVAVLGNTVWQELFAGSDPVGQTIRVKNLSFQVIGTFKAKGYNSWGRDQDDVIIVPYTTVQKKFLGGALHVESGLVQAVNSRATYAAEEQIRALLRQRHRLGPFEDDDFMVRNLSEIGEAAEATNRMMGGLLAVIASVSLLVGGIGIMNIMLVAVSERTREIGIRMAIGARPSHVRIQFLSESIGLCLMGGILGLLLGVGVSIGIPLWLGWPTVISINSVIISILFSGTIGIFFGYYPAHKAAALDPIEALRYE